ncbi:MAG TPA: hypothetical protein VKT72_15195 [Candidatus Baltobacteraceae bacterium]|nr:hypothetical protein [Candidatus Baltobacteraceae bacterium]
MRSSPAKQVAQLLRSLDDRDAIMRHELVADAFGGRRDDAAFHGLRSAVLDAIDSMRPYARDTTQDGVHRSRQYEIITRYERNGTPMADVLAALGIEKSQFYRERAAALAYIARAIRRWIKNLGTMQTGGLASDEQYRIASVLQRTGNAALAERVLQGLLCEQFDASQKSIVLVRLAELNIDTGAAHEASAHLRAAAQLCESLTPEQADILACEREVVRARLAWLCGQTEDAQRVLSRVLPGAKSLLGRNFMRAKLVLAKALAAAATLEYHVGTLQRCQLFVSMGRELLGSADDQTADVLAELLTIQTSIHTAQEPTLAEAMSVDQALLELARAHGLVRKIAVGVKDLAVINHYQGNLPVASLYVDEAVALSTAVCGMKERAVATFQWAHILVERHADSDWQRVRDELAAIRAELPPLSYWWGYSFAIESYVRLAESRITEAQEAADKALSAFAAVRSSRGMAIAKSLHAQALHAIGDRTLARSYAKEAVRLLETSPQPCWLSHARKQLAIA